MSSIYEDYPLSDDGLRCPDCGRVDCECQEKFESAMQRIEQRMIDRSGQARPIQRDPLLQDAKLTANEEREARGEHE